jgi:hypothetical protein
MNKLPVFQTISRAYAFVIAEAGTIFRLSWLPLLIAAAVQYAAVRSGLELIRAAVAGGQTSVGRFTLWQALGTLIAMIGAAIVAVSIHRLALFGERKEGKWLNLQFGKVEFLFLVVPMLILMPLMVLFVLAFIGGELFAAAVTFLLIIAGLYLFVRLALLFPLMVVEGRALFRQAWEMSKGNFWRLFGVLILGSLPLILLGVLVGFLAGDPLAVNPNSEDPKEIIRQLEFSLTPVSLVTNYVFTIIGSAIGVALLSFSYIGLGGRR